MTARDHALAALDAIQLPDWPAYSLPKRAARPAPLRDERDVHLAARIEHGVISNLLLLNHLIEHFSGRPLKRIDPLVRKILAIGLYQILFLDRVGAHAAVNEAVNQTRRLGKQSAAGFVNAVLRRATREPMPPLPDPATDPREHARLALSHPPELFDRLVAILGDANEALKSCRFDNRPPPTILRLRRGVALSNLAAPTDVKLIPHERGGMVVMQPTRSALLREWSKKGIAQAQDPTAAAVAGFVAAQEGDRVLDRCCGLGTKTMQLVEQVGPAGRVVAVDPSPQRTQTLRELLADRGISNVQVVQAAWMRDLPPELQGPFDRVLIDTPCSNSGVLARRSAARYAQDDRALASLRNLQMQILADTAPHVAVGGTLVYSTCSIWPEENEQLVDGFLAQHREFQRAQSQLTLPSFDIEFDPIRYHDGGYVACLRRCG